MNFVIEKPQASLEDETFARIAHHQAYRDVVISQYGDWNDTEQDEFFKKSWSPLSMEILLCNNIQCGYCKIARTPFSIGVAQLVLLTEFQGQGIGTYIPNEVIKEASVAHVPVYLQVLKKNRAHTLYRKLGFIDTKETVTHFEMVYRPDL